MELEELERYSENENLYLVVGCDSNAHHSVWGSTNCNSRGKALVEFINSSNLEILNQENEPTFCSGGKLEVRAPRKHYRLVHQSPPCRIIDISMSFYKAPYQYA